jgi:hypothetical protein
MGSLGGQADSPINAAVALSIVLAQVASAPWSNSFITFSAQPEIVTFNGEDGLGAIARSMGSAAWGMNTDFNAVFTKVRDYLPRNCAPVELFGSAASSYGYSA